MVSTEIKLWFLSSLEHFWLDPLDTLSEVALFFEKMHKVFKNKAQGCSTPLSSIFSSYRAIANYLAYLISEQNGSLERGKSKLSVQTKYLILVIII